MLELFGQYKIKKPIRLILNDLFSILQERVDKLNDDSWKS